MNALFFDFDGTLRVPETNQVSKLTIQSLKTLKEQGHILMINTGRCFSSLKNQAEGLPVDGEICGCGTWIRYQGELLYRVEASESQKQKVFDALRLYQVDAFLEGHDSLFMDRRYSGEVEKVYHFFRKMNVEIKEIEDPTCAFSKMSLYYRDEHQKQQFENTLSDDFDFIHFPDLKAEAVLKGHSKASGMEWLMKKLGLPKNVSIAFGDSDNDADMLKEAHCSILIGDHAPHLKDLANLKAPSAKDEGITWALKKLQLL